MTFNFNDLYENALFLHDTGGYDWEIILVAEREEDGAVYMFESSGCSCNSPADDFQSWEDGVPITDLNTFLRAIDGVHVYDRPSAVEVVRGAAEIQKRLVARHA